jgi:hypothetical protein
MAGGLHLQRSPTRLCSNFDLKLGSYEKVTPPRGNLERANHLVRLAGHGHTLAIRNYDSAYTLLAVLTVLAYRRSLSKLDTCK